MSASIVLRDELQKRGISIREAAHEMGTTHTTLHRILNGEPMSLSMLNKIATWMGVPPASLVGLETGELDVILDVMPPFRDTLAEAWRLIGSGQLPANFMDDVTAYIRFRIDRDRLPPKENPLEKG
jgi:transcriptional regulator with XRE-family HTH domain